MQRLRSFALRKGSEESLKECDESLEGGDGRLDTLGSGELLIWSEAASLHNAKELRACFQRILKRNGFEIEDIDGLRDVMTPTRDIVEHEATHVGVVKRLRPAAQLEQAAGSARLCGALHYLEYDSFDYLERHFLATYASERDVWDLECLGMEADDFDYTTREVFEGVNGQGFFSPAEICMLSHRILYSIKVDAELAAEAAEWLPSTARHVVEGQPALRSLQGAGIIEEVMPIHNPPFVQGLVPKVFTPFPDASSIHTYYGDEVAMYFAWMAFMCRWLAVPGGLGLATFIIHQLTGETVEDSHYAPFFSAAMIVWACLFVKFWKRKEAVLSVKWGSIWTTSREEVRPEFSGEWRRSPITGEQERYFPSWRRWPRYAVSMTVTAFMLCIAFCVMICSLNLQGYIQDTEDTFKIPFLACYSAPSAVFDPLRSARGGLLNFVMPLVPVLLHAGTIFVLNQIMYRSVAEWLTGFENHRTEAAHRTSLIIKRVFFEAFDCYVALFYLAFWQRDILKVRAELKALFTADCIRRIATEVLLPWLLQSLSAASKATQLAVMKRKVGGRAALVQAVGDSLKAEYEDFDDYIEMAIQFGYVTMFAAAMPAAAAIACAYTFIEMRSDLVKLLFLQRRPVATRATGIGIWAKIIECQAWLAIATNSVVFAFSSDQVAELAPQLFRPPNPLDAPLLAPLADPQSPEKVLTEGSGRWLVAVWALAEHALVLVAVVLHAVIPSTPESVTVAVERKHWLEQRTVHEKRHLDRVALVAQARRASADLDRAPDS